MHEPQNKRTRHENLLQRIEPASTWADIVLGEQQIRVLRELSAASGHVLQVSEERQSKIKSSPDRGIIALFRGASGTGKAMAAEVLARDLHRELYRIDLTRVVSKYIGETEKNLSGLFTEAAASGAILFFDEADALFGKHSEVKDSHDRYANIEVSYFSRRMQEHRGLIIIGTKTRVEWPPVLMSRMGFVVEF